MPDFLVSDPERGPLATTENLDGARTACKTLIGEGESDFLTIYEYVPIPRETWMRTADGHIGTTASDGAVT